MQINKNKILNKDIPDKKLYPPKRPDLCATLFLDVNDCLFLLKDGTFNRKLVAAVDRWTRKKSNNQEGKQCTDRKNIIVWSAGKELAEEAALWLEKKLGTEIQPMQKTKDTISNLTSLDTVVDDDKMLLTIAKARGAKTMTPEEFIQEVLEDLLFGE